MEAYAAVELAQILEARERRASRQAELLARYRLPLVSFTMNIAGPVKNSPLIRRGFRVGDALLRGQLARTGAACVFSETLDAPSGCEGFYVVDMDARALKRLTEEMEEASPLGRLFDMDVFAPRAGESAPDALSPRIGESTPEGFPPHISAVPGQFAGEKLDRAVPRRCLICGGNAKACASRRIHAVEALQAKTREILRTELDRRDAETVASLACRALLYEVCVTPKPGLVDRNNNGSHGDMDIYTFLNSSAALWPWFAECFRMGRAAVSQTADTADEAGIHAETGRQTARETFAALRLPGKLAEISMLSATGGVNTHKGAIFSMGLLCAALGRLDREAWSQPERILSEAAAMAEGLTERDFAAPPQSEPPGADTSPDADIPPGADAPAPLKRGAKEEDPPLLRGGRGGTSGERLYWKYGVTGVRGQAEAGFPAVLRYGLPVLERGLALGKSPDEAGSAAMLAILAHSTDTNLIARGGLSAQRETAAQIAALLEKTPYPDKATLEQLDRAFIAQNLSPGGSADLLALCWLLHFLRKEKI